MATSRSPRPSRSASPRGKASGKHAPSPRPQEAMPPKMATRPQWPAGEELFPPLAQRVTRLLEQLPALLHEVRPLNAGHRRSLPGDVARLSRLLTSERRELTRPYWGDPALVSAYLYYFLPWNLIRLTRLLQALPLPEPQGEGGSRPLLMDVGTGPLTLPLAMWLARPQWRALPIQVLGLDSAAQPAQLGRALFEVLAGSEGLEPWPVHLAQGPLESLPRHVSALRRSLPAARPWLVTAANVLNELRPKRNGRAAFEDDDMEGGEESAQGMAQSPADERLEGLLAAFAPLLGQDAAAGLLFVEPGTRLGGTTIMHLRQCALAGGLSSLAPCTHNQSCPILARQGGRTWCHFTFAGDAPAWLRKLSADAGLAKQALSLSPLLLGLPQEGKGRGEHLARVVSQPFDVPGVWGRARYACTANGLALLENAERLPSGCCLPVPQADGGRRDARSHAPILAPVGKGGA